MLPTITPTTILMVAVIIVIATASVLLISKIGGKKAKKDIQKLHGIKFNDED